MESVSSPDRSEARVSSLTGRAQLSQINMVLQRLSRKSELTLLAQEILAGLRDDQRLIGNGMPFPMVGEASKAVGCGKDPETGDPPPSPSTFECAQNAFACIPNDQSGADFECNQAGKTFDCGPLPFDYDCSSEENFTCAPNTQFECDTDSVYGGCSGEKEKFDCQEGDYNCGGDEKTDDKIFDCHDFECTTQDGAEPAFECDGLLDFNCGEKFLCKDEFDCSAGHVFMCAFDHDCDDSFTCSATGKTKCDPEEYKYDNPQGPDPGDFTCGTGVEGQPNTDDFDCKDDFDCAAKDEFDCPQGASFDCGTGEATDSFECDTTGTGNNAGFDCAPTSSFKCNPVSEFDCNRANDYSCTNPTGKYEDSPPG